MLSEEGIMGECEPEDMAQQAQEALCEQIKKLQVFNYLFLLTFLIINP